MIIYFSACGNSKQAASMLAEKTDDRIVSINSAFIKKEFDYELEKGENLAFVFPVYFWGVPSIVLDFIKLMNIKNVEESYVYAALTCGSSSGLTGKMLKKALAKRNICLDAEYAIVMPDTYVVMFPVNKDEEAIKILDKAEVEIDEVAKAIKDKKTGKTNKHKGRMKQLITYITYPLYNKVYRKTKRFSVNDKCTGCTICSKVCPIGAIEMTGEEIKSKGDVVKNKPQWTMNKCVHCLACVHRCPEQAINNGKSQNHGRYVNPRVKLD